jgi:serine/threonine-protein kinase
MASEQARGEVAGFTEATDVVGLGGVLYGILAGRAPFARPGDHRDMIIKRCLEADALPPQKVNRTVPPRLEAVCLKCLKKDPEDRYASVAALKSDLQEWLDTARK